MVNVFSNLTLLPRLEKLLFKNGISLSMYNTTNLLANRIFVSHNHAFLS